MSEFEDIIDENKGTDCLFIFDDVMHELTKSKVMDELSNNQRHIMFKEQEEVEREYENSDGEIETYTEIIPEAIGTLTIAIVLQKYIVYPLEYRNNTDIIFIFKPEPREYERLYEDELTTFIDKKDYKDFYNFIWDEKYNFLIINKLKNKLYKNFDEIIIN